MTSREKVLNRINKALKNPSGINSINVDLEARIKNSIDSITPKDEDLLWQQFEKELTAIAGEFYSVKNLDEAAQLIINFAKETDRKNVAISSEQICADVAMLVQQQVNELNIVSPKNLNHQKRKAEFASIETAIVHPSFAIADIGSLVFLYDQTGTSYPHFLCDNIFAIINKNQIVANQFELFEKLESEKTKNMVIVTGPSRTADIEKVLVLGAHGPRKLVVLKF